MLVMPTLKAMKQTFLNLVYGKMYFADRSRKCDGHIDSLPYVAVKNVYIHSDLFLFIPTGSLSSVKNTIFHLIYL